MPQFEKSKVCSERQRAALDLWSFDGPAPRKRVIFRWVENVFHPGSSAPMGGAPGPIIDARQRLFIVFATETVRCADAVFFFKYK